MTDEELAEYDNLSREQWRSGHISDSGRSLISRLIAEVRRLKGENEGLRIECERLREFDTSF